jgi:hypothetical protein
MALQMTDRAAALAEVRDSLLKSGAVTGRPEEIEAPDAPLVDEKLEGAEPADPDDSEELLIEDEEQASDDPEIVLDENTKLPLSAVKAQLEEYRKVQSNAASLFNEQQASFLRELEAFREVAGQVSEEYRAAERAMAEAEAIYERINWEELDQSNPGLAANHRQKLLSRYMAAKESMEEAQAKQQQTYQLHQQQLAAHHAQATLGLIPEWKDPQRQQAEVQGILQYAEGIGIPVSDFQGVIPAAYRRVLRDAYLYNKAKSAKGRLAETTRRTAARSVTPDKAAKRAQEALIEKARTGSKVDKRLAARSILFPNL